MHRHKNFLFGLGLLLTVVIGTLFATGGSISAVTAPPIVKVGDDFEFVNKATITGTINGQSVTFEDSDVVNDNTRHYTPQNIDEDIFCEEGNGVSWGITIDKNVNIEAETVRGRVSFGYKDVSGQNTPCKSIPPENYKPSRVIDISNPNNLASASYSWQGADIVNISFDTEKYSPTHTYSDSLKDVYIDEGGVSGRGASCTAGGLIIATGSNSGILYKFTGVRGGGKAIPPEIKKYLTENNQNLCRLSSGPTNIVIAGGQTGSGGGATDGTTGSACFNKNGEPVKDNGVVRNGVCKPDEIAAGFENDKACFNGKEFLYRGECKTTEARTCESNGTLKLEWIFCPILRGIDAAIQQFYNEVEDQLCFKAGPSDTRGAVVCGDNNVLEAKPTNKGNVKDAWSVMRMIATSLLVIAMLLMVMSQAMNFGPLDPYTARKLLPKLVAAAILIQISWFLAKFAIDLSNDIGQGIKDLMYAPFGPDIDNIDVALKDIGSQGVVLGLGALFGSLILITVFSGLTVIGIGFIAFTGILAVLVGYLVLVFRSILIILCVIFVPVALIMWILPGTERYWKLWRETFLKLLMMFPLIMILIAAGRIFGSIGGTMGGVTGLIMVLVGFFGPLFVLPKTFNWGGQALGAMSGAVINGTKGLRRKPMEAAMAYGKENRQFRANQRADRLAEGTSRYKKLDELLSGKYNFARGNFLGGGDARRRHFEGTRAGGREEAEKAAIASLVGSPFEQLNHDSIDPNEMTKVKAAKMIAAGEDVPEIGLSGKDNPVLRLHMLEQLGPTWGDWDKVTDLRDEQAIPPRIWQRFMQKHIGTVHTQAPHLSPLSSKADLSGIGYQEYIGAKDEFFKELPRQLVDGKVRETKDSATMGTLVDIIDPNDRADQIVKGMGNIHGFLDDRLMDGRISTENRENLEQTLVDIPLDLGKAEIRAKLIEHISTGMAASPQSQEGKLGRSLIGALANRVAGAPAGSAEETNFKGLMDQLRTAAPSSPQATQIHNALLSGLEGQLSQMSEAAQRDAVAAGHDAPGVQAAVDTATTHARDKIARISGLGTGGPLAPI